LALPGLQQEGKGTNRAEGLWVGVGGFLPAFGIKITLTSRQPWKMAVSQGKNISSVRCCWAGKKGLKELIAHLMQSGFEMLSILWSSRFSSMWRSSTT